MPDPVLPEAYARLVNASQKAAASQRDEILSQLVQRYASHPAEAEATAIRQAFLLVLKDMPSESVAGEHASFLAEAIQPEDFRILHWNHPEQPVSFCELLYSIPLDAEQAGRVTEHVNSLLNLALQQFEAEGDLAKAFSLLQLAPTSPQMGDHELRRLRSRAHLFEMQRVRRNRRLLFGYLALQVLLVFLVFPLLFIQAENGYIQDELERSAQLDLPEEARRNFTYPEGLYWALITAASIGYGDITPQTEVGKVIAAVLGVLGVITVGVIAGLILEWITPRQID